MPKSKRWRVRVRRAVEQWVDVKADDALQAEQLAASLPQVVSVFGRSAIPGDRPVDQVPLAGVMEDGDE